MENQIAIAELLTGLLEHGEIFNTELFLSGKSFRAINGRVIFC